MSDGNPFWSCGCVKRNSGGDMTHFKMNHVTLASCKACGCDRPPLGMYYCSKCDRLHKRDSDKGWIMSYCEKSGRNVRMWRK